MATAQVVSATTALHDEKIEEQSIDKPQEHIKNTESTVSEPESEPQLQEDHLPEEVAPEPELASTEPESEPEAETKPEPESEPVLVLEPEALAVEVETKVVVKEEENQEATKVSSVDQLAKVAPEPCVEEEANETIEPEPKPVETEPTEVGKAEPEEKDEGVATEE